MSVSGADGYPISIPLPFYPKVALFFLAFLPQFADRSRDDVAAQMLVLGIVFTLIGLGSGLSRGLVC